MAFTFFDLFEELLEGSPAVPAIENSPDSQGVHLKESFSPSTSDAANCNDTSVDMTMLTHQENDETDEENDSEELALRANDITNKKEQMNTGEKKSLPSFR